MYVFIKVSFLCRSHCIYERFHWIYETRTNESCTNPMSTSLVQIQWDLYSLDLHKSLYSLDLYKSHCICTSLVGFVQVSLLIGFAQVSLLIAFAQVSLLMAFVQVSLDLYKSHYSLDLYKSHCICTSLVGFVQVSFVRVSFDIMFELLSEKFGISHTRRYVSHIFTYTYYVYADVRVCLFIT